LLLDTRIWVVDDNVYLVLKDNDLVKVHDLNSGQMLTGLRLGAWLVASDEQKGRVHDSCSGEHSSHEDIVTWAIDEGDMTHEEELVVAVPALGLVLLA